MSTTPAAVRRLRCARCARCEYAMDVTADELLGFSHGEWPRCCALPMILDVDDHSVNPGESTEVERPSRRNRKMFPG